LAVSSRAAAAACAVRVRVRVRVGVRVRVRIRLPPGLGFLPVGGGGGCLRGTRVGIGVGRHSALL
jgi:hypothetical protein